MSILTLCVADDSRWQMIRVMADNQTEVLAAILVHGTYEPPLSPARISSAMLGAWSCWLCISYTASLPSSPRIHQLNSVTLMYLSHTSCQHHTAFTHRQSVFVYLFCCSMYWLVHAGTAQSPVYNWCLHACDTFEIRVCVHTKPGYRAWLRCTDPRRNIFLSQLFLESATYICFPSRLTTSPAFSATALETT